MTISNTSAIAPGGKSTAVRENGKLGGRPVEYRQFHSYGFLRVSRWDSERQEYVRIGSFAGAAAPARAQERIDSDKARHAGKTPV